MKLNKKILTSVLALSSFLLIASPVFADEEIRNLTVDLKVKGFSQEIWQDNIDSKSMILGPNDKIEYQMIFKNNGNRNQTWIEVDTKLPSTIITSESMNFKINQLVPNQEFVKTFVVYLKDKDQLNYEITKNIISTSIKSEVGTVASDESSFYSNNGSKNTTVATSSSQQLPASGMPLLLSTILGSSLITFAVFARKFARGY